MDLFLLFVRLLIVLISASTASTLEFSPRLFKQTANEWAASNTKNTQHIENLIVNGVSYFSSLESGSVSPFSSSDVSSFFSELYLLLPDPKFRLSRFSAEHLIKNSHVIGQMLSISEHGDGYKFLREIDRRYRLLFGRNVSRAVSEVKTGANFDMNSNDVIQWLIKALIFTNAYLPPPKTAYYPTFPLYYSPFSSLPAVVSTISPFSNSPGGYSLFELISFFFAAYIRSYDVGVSHVNVAHNLRQVLRQRGKWTAEEEEEKEGKEGKEGEIGRVLALDAHRNVSIQLAHSAEEIFAWYKIFDEHLNTLYYAVSYIVPSCDCGFKRHINAVLQHIHAESHTSSVVSSSSSSSSSSPSILVITSFWFSSHSVYRTLSRYVDALYAHGYNIDLCNVGPLHRNSYSDDEKDKEEEEDKRRREMLSVFRSVTVYEQPSDHEKAMAIMRYAQSRQYAIVWYPAVGMSWVDVFLSNMRLAPLQVASPGHSVSSCGTQIDYFISGRQVEALVTMQQMRQTNKKTTNSGDKKETAGHEQNNANAKNGRQHLNKKQNLFSTQYSERLVLLPGLGVVHNRPLYPVDAIVSSIHRAERRDRLRFSEIKNAIMKTTKMMKKTEAESATTTKKKTKKRTMREDVSEKQWNTSEDAVDEDDPSTVIINCPFSPQKLNYNYLQRLRAIIERVRTYNEEMSAKFNNDSDVDKDDEDNDDNNTIFFRPIKLVFRFFSLIQTRLKYLVFMRSLRTALGLPLIDDDNRTSSAAATSNSPLVTLSLFGSLSYSRYFSLLSSSSLTLESSPFGGCNTVVDALYAAQATVLSEGRERWNARIGTSTLRAVVDVQEEVEQRGTGERERESEGEGDAEWRRMFGQYEETASSITATSAINNDGDDDVYFASSTLSSVDSLSSSSSSSSTTVSALTTYPERYAPTVPVDSRGYAEDVLELCVSRGKREFVDKAVYLITHPEARHKVRRLLFARFHSSLASNFSSSSSSGIFGDESSRALLLNQEHERRRKRKEEKRRRNKNKNNGNDDDDDDADTITAPVRVRSDEDWFVVALQYLHRHHNSLLRQREEAERNRVRDAERIHAQRRRAHDKQRKEEGEVGQGVDVRYGERERHHLTLPVLDIEEITMTKTTTKKTKMTNKTTNKGTVKNKREVTVDKQQQNAKHPSNRNEL